MCISTGNSDSNFFSGSNAPFWTKKFDQNERYYSKQFVSTIPLKPLNRISWNFVVMKDIICRYFYRKCGFDLFKEQFISLLNFGQNGFVQLRWNWLSTGIINLNAEENLFGKCKLTHLIYLPILKHLMEEG